MKVLVLDDSSALRERLRASLAHHPEIEFLGEKSDPLDAIRLVRELKPDTVSLNMRAHRRFGINILRNIKRAVPAPVVIMLTNKFYPDSNKGCVMDGVDFSFDKFTEMDKVLNLFVQPRRKVSAKAGV